MNWEAIGAIGEILGALGVIVSLFYVANQVKHNTKQTEQNTAALEISSNETMADLVNSSRWKIAESEEISRIYMAGLEDPESLSELDLMRFRLTMAAVMQIFQLAHQQVNLGFRRSVSWDNAVHVLKRNFATKGGKWYWKNYGHEWELDFQEAVDDLIRSGKTSSS